MKKLLRAVFPWSYATTTVKILLFTMAIYLFVAAIVSWLCGFLVPIFIIGIAARIVAYAAELYFFIGSAIAIVTFTNAKFNEGGWNK